MKTKNKELKDMNKILFDALQDSSGKGLETIAYHLTALLSSKIRTYRKTKCSLLYAKINTEGKILINNQEIKCDIISTVFEVPYREILSIKDFFILFDNRLETSAINIVKQEKQLLKNFKLQYKCNRNQKILMIVPISAEIKPFDFPPDLRIIFSIFETISFMVIDNNKKIKERR